MRHPLQRLPSEQPAPAGAAKPLAGRAEAELALSGHLHATFVTPLAGAAGISSVQAGTCLSHMVRGDGTAFHLMQYVPEGLVLAHYRTLADGRFRADTDIALIRGAAGWA